MKTPRGSQMLPQPFGEKKENPMETNQNNVTAEETTTQPIEGELTSNQLENIVGGALVDYFRDRTHNY